ncbi:hypothetical protein SAMD00023353_9600170 [Rosellinia necatrix]|uniref:Uncharacterized protein n=1 Tax=Rosellinia necatrix TaxID=77044 RepID=A0A1S8AAX7_ROSNE|nr:hypothetical protein SAMD00023353_9600170 [Rosellinia necatrix]
MMGIGGARVLERSRKILLELGQRDKIDVRLHDGEFIWRLDGLYVKNGSQIKDMAKEVLEWREEIASGGE